jgi:hypothetical protein
MDSLANELRRKEEALLDPAVRKDREQVGSLLAEDFLEFGSSGRVWTRDQIFDLLATETYAPFAIEDFNCALLSNDIALVTYRAMRSDARSGDQSSSLRSSIWIRKQHSWQLRFHQGTRIP